MPGLLDVQLLVLAKAPAAGRSKTRLCPPLTLEQAADVARAALLDTLDAVAATPVRRRVLVLDGPVGELLPLGWDLLLQRGDGLDERLVAAFTDASASAPWPVLLVGMDTPQLDADLLTSAATALIEHGSALGLTEDGGWWTAGLTDPRPEHFTGVPMSTDHTGADQLTRFGELGLAPAQLGVLRDIDTWPDLVAVAGALPPILRTAQELDRLEGARVP